MPDVEEVLRAAKSLEPEERLRLMARLWASLPPDDWAAPNAADRRYINLVLSDHDGELLDQVPWKLVERLLDRYAALTGTKLYSAPRRFDLATIFIVTTAYAVLFACMSALQFPPGASISVGVFLALVAIGQAVLYGGRRPRRASVVAGVVTMLVLWGGSFMMFNPGLPPGAWAIVSFIIGVVIYGVILGYIAGVFVGSVFLVADFVRRRFRREPPVFYLNDRQEASDAVEPSSL